MLSAVLHGFCCMSVVSFNKVSGFFTFCCFAPWLIRPWLFRPLAFLSPVAPGSFTSWFVHPLADSPPHLGRFTPLCNLCYLFLSKNAVIVIKIPFWVEYKIKIKSEICRSVLELDYRGLLEICRRVYQKIVAIFIPNDAAAIEPGMMTFVFVLRSLIMLNISSR